MSQIVRNGRAGVDLWWRDATGTRTRTRHCIPTGIRDPTERFDLSNESVTWEFTRILVNSSKIRVFLREICWGGKVGVHIDRVGTLKVAPVRIVRKSTGVSDHLDVPAPLQHTRMGSVKF